MKAILMSIKPKWVVKILNGEKTIEIRKTMPKCEFPIDVYIYCLKDRKYGYMHNGQSIRPSSVVAKFTLNKVEKIDYDYPPEPYETFYRKSCLTPCELFDYIGHHPWYIYHIENLEIFDRPKELSEFKTYKTYNLKDLHNCHLSLVRPPQSWCYIESED